MMDNSALNTAHYHSRRADNHLRHRRYNDAIESHQKAAAALDEVATQCSTNNAKAIESIKLQRDFHLKHIELVRLKKQQYEKYKSAIDQQRAKNADLPSTEQRTAKEHTESVCDLQISIFKTLEKSDRLLNALQEGHRSAGRKSLDSDGSGNNTIIDTSKPIVSIDNACNEVKMMTIRTVKSSDNKSCAVVDDMSTLNHQLHILVYNLVKRVDESTREVETVRDRNKVLEKERNNNQQTVPVLTTARKASSANSSMKTDDSTNTSAAGGATSSDRDINRRCSFTGEERKIILPESSDLPPLELPEFDYSSFDD